MKLFRAWFQGSMSMDQAIAEGAELRNSCTMELQRTVQIADMYLS